MKTFSQFGVAAIIGFGLCGSAVVFGAEATAMPFPMGGPICRGGTAVFIDPAGGVAGAGAAGAAGASGVAGGVGVPGAPGGVGAAGGAGVPGGGGPAGVASPAERTLVDVATSAPCGPESADLTTLAGPAVPMAFPGPVPAAPVVPAAPPVPVLPPPVPVVPGGPPPVPFVAPGPAGAAAASPIAGVLTDAAGLPLSLAGGTK